jgi:hypothetical protein
MCVKLSRFGLALAGLLLALGAQASEYNKGFNNTNYAMEDVKPWEEGKYTLPDFPAAPDWIGFYVGPEVANKYFADSKSMTVGEDGVVRLILRVQSPAGAENLSVEGIQCSANTYRSYALATASTNAGLHPCARNGARLNTMTRPAVPCAKTCA